MTGWTIHDGQAVALPLESIDTDQLIPARFMSTPRSAGYHDFLLYDLRHDAEGALRPDHALNRHRGVSVLIARRNFGSGSSREAAVYALADFGFRAVIAPSFGDIFALNAVNNGLLPAQLATEAVEEMLAALGDGTMPVRIDLSAGTVTLGNLTRQFALKPQWRDKLVNGWDDIDLTLQHHVSILDYRQRRKTEVPHAVLGIRRE